MEKTSYHDKAHLISDKKSLSGGGTPHQDVGVIVGLIVVSYQLLGNARMAYQR